VPFEQAFQNRSFHLELTAGHFSPRTHYEPVQREHQPDTESEEQDQQCLEPPQPQRGDRVEIGAQDNREGEPDFEGVDGDRTIDGCDVSADPVEGFIIHFLFEFGEERKGYFFDTDDNGEIDQDWGYDLAAQPQIVN
jgi:hypothetical protein